MGWPENAAVASIDLTDGDGGLSPTYQRALQLEEAGCSSAEIGEALGVTPEAVPLLLDLARRKRDNRITAKQPKG